MTPTDNIGEGLTIMIGGKVVQTIPLISPQNGRTVVRYHMVEIIHEPTQTVQRFIVEQQSNGTWTMVSSHEKLSEAAAAYEKLEADTSCAVRLFDTKKNVALEERASSTEPQAESVVDAQQTAPAVTAWGKKEGTPDERLLADEPHDESSLLAAVLTSGLSASYDCIEIRDAQGQILHQLH